MATVGTRELKQNPHAVVRQVLETGEAVVVTTHGHPTGVALVPTHVGPRRWVRGADLARVALIDDDAVSRLHDDLASVDQDDEPADPWAPRA
ncbi:type II toxin-antitoxin system Phd/YefM family antitoxin [Cellulomonas sp. SLBN-39]|uniref:type II toxin-antitoxin system Phd/YefM family antitoxin n=1 Tax=Cellulomonas sp. SLBN-39 TaxID=2768446 RepID=UPI00114FE2A3|nr:type II toxin-antitoxin system Phd/YefM family antitoxin [Cellulomonas sp. SLBN-39]TQL02697.1 antitoxin Phd_YefM of type II toxin-antitoxin system [Cellulomonas sp. SLBN-39]